MSFVRLVISVFCIAAFAGCASQSVLVIDAMKKPVSGAKVEPISLSMNYAVLTTDASGVTKLPWVPQKIEWVSVKKEGFEPSGQIAIGDNKRTTIVLCPSK